MKKIDNKGQVSIEWLTLAGAVIILTAAVTAMTFHLITIKDALEKKIVEYREKLIQMM